MWIHDCTTFHCCFSPSLHHFYPFLYPKFPSLSFLPSAAIFYFLFIPILSNTSSLFVSFFFERNIINSPFIFPLFTRVLSSGPPFSFFPPPFSLSYTFFCTLNPLYTVHALFRPRSLPSLLLLNILTHFSSFPFYCFILFRKSPPSPLPFFVILNFIRRELRKL